MGQRTDISGKVIQNILLLAVIFVLLHLANITEVLSYLAKPLVVVTARLLGFAAVNRGTEIVIGKLVLPWTQECSGINTLIMLWGITLWANRNQPLAWFLPVRLALCIPVALVANVFRIFTLAGYRYIFFPNWESQQLHYLIGFVWLIPCLAIFVKDFRTKSSAQWLEIFYMAVVLALLAPVVFSPGGSIIAVCALLYMAQNRIRETGLRENLTAYSLWAFFALLIGWSRMESLWIPWLLVCPMFVNRAFLFSVGGMIILTGTVFFSAMQPWWQPVIFAALVFHVYKLATGRYAPAGEAAPPPPKIMEVALLAVLAMAPFMLPGTVGVRHEMERPPSGVMARQLTFNTYQLRVPGQPADIAVFWYGAYGDGRHHTLSVCMRFRGVVLERVDGEKDVMTGMGRWMREYFIQDNKLRSTYSEYLLASFSPFSSPGVHIIFEAPSGAMSPGYFARESERIVQSLYRDAAAVPPGKI